MFHHKVLVLFCGLHTVEDVALTIELILYGFEEVAVCFLLCTIFCCLGHFVFVVGPNLHTTKRFHLFQDLLLSPLNSRQIWYRASLLIHASIEQASCMIVLVNPWTFR